MEVLDSVMLAIDVFRVDKEKFSVLSSFEEADEADKAYWHSKTPKERLEGLELMRQINYGYDPCLNDMVFTGYF